MVLNWTLEVFGSMISATLIFAAAVLILRQHWKNPDRALIFMSSTYMMLGLFFSFSGLGYLFLSPSISLIKNIWLVGICLTITMTINQMIIGRVLSIPLVIVSFLSAFAIFPFFLPIEESVIRVNTSNFESLRNVGLNRIILALLFIYVIASILYFSLKIFRHSPKSLRQHATIYFIGNSFLILATFAFIFGLSTTVPAIVELMVSVGIILSSIGLIAAPQILYVLPFSAIKLSIIKADTGISFYNYYWRGNLDDTADQLFGAAFSAITNFMQETLGEGEIREVKLEGATISISRPTDQSVYYVVIATKPSYVLKKGLEQFSRSFNQLYGDIINDESRYDVQEFQAADELIPICFPYIPVQN